MCSALHDRVRGVLLGLAAGDRIGGPGAMACRLANSLMQCGRFDLTDVRRRYMAWWEAEGFDTGPVAAAVFERVAGGMDPATAPARVHQQHDGLTAGCNPAHRTPPLAMAGFLSDAQVAQAAREEAAITHFHPLAGEVAAAGAILCRCLIRGEPWLKAVETTASQVPTASRDALVGWNRPPADRGGYAPVVLHAAAYFAGSSDRFDDALHQAIGFAGDANYCPVLCGALAGARWGASSVAESWLEHRHGTEREHMKAIAARLAHMW